MKIVLFGATGLTGHEILKQALDEGHEVKAVVRKPSQIELEHSNLSVVQGDVFNPQSVQEAVGSGEVVQISYRLMESKLAERTWQNSC